MRTQVKSPEIEYRRAVLIGSVPKTVFEETHEAVELEIFSADPKPTKLLMMQDLHEIKRLNASFTADLDIDELIDDCYRQLFVRFGQGILALAGFLGGGSGGSWTMAAELPGFVISDYSDMDEDAFLSKPEASQERVNVTMKEVSKRAITVCKSPPQPKPRPLPVILPLQAPPLHQAPHLKEPSPIDHGNIANHETVPSTPLLGSRASTPVPHWGNTFAPLVPMAILPRPPPS